MTLDLRETIESLSRNPGISESKALLQQTSPDYREYSREECCEMAERLFSYWLGILRREPSLVDGSDEGEPDIDQSWRQASCCVAKFFVPALVRAEKVLLDLEVRRGSDWFPFTKHGLNGMANLCTPDYGFDAAVERRLLSEFLSGIWDLHFMTVVGSPVLGKTPQGWDEFVYMSFRAIGRVGLASGKLEHLMLANLVSEALAMRAQSAVHERDKNDFDFRSKVAGSFVVTEELGSLARRDASVVKRYGESEVEVRFEQQLSFLMQSFGFIVVTTQRAQRRVDLICIAQGASGDSFTFLVEAKTTGASYSLPTRDARAITEYVSSVRQALKTLPRLRLVLLVSGSLLRPLTTSLVFLRLNVALRCDIVTLCYCNAYVVLFLARWITRNLSRSLLAPGESWADRR